MNKEGMTVHQDQLIVKEALAGKSAKEIKKVLKDEKIDMKAKEIIAHLASRGFIYDKHAEKWVQVKPFHPFTDKEITKLKELVTIDSTQKLQQTLTRDIQEVAASLATEERKSKTFYIDQGLAQQAKEFAEEKGIKLAEFVEIALLDALDKYR